VKFINVWFSSDQTQAWSVQEDSDLLAVSGAPAIVSFNPELTYEQTFDGSQPNHVDEEFLTTGFVGAGSFRLLKGQVVYVRNLSGSKGVVQLFIQPLS
jgi:hypothetical protein